MPTTDSALGRTDAKEELIKLRALLAEKEQLIADQNNQNKLIEK